MQKLMFRLPRLGGAESEARVLAWKKAPGEAFSQGETLLEVETDKAVVDVPAPADGTLVLQLKAVDAYAEFDEALAEIELDDAMAAVYRAATGTPPGAPAAEAPPPAAPAAPATAGAASPLHRGRPRATPVARKLALAAGIDLSRIAGSGPAGRIVRDDVLRLQAGSPSGASNRPVDGIVKTRQGEVFVRRWNGAMSQGAGQPTTVLIHGLFGDTDTWAALAAGLAEQGRSVLAMDLPAHGRTTAEACTLDELVDVLAQVLAALVPGPKLLVGHSLGGALAVRLARLATAGPVVALALVAPAGLGSEINQGFINGMLHAGSPALLRRELAKLAHRLPAFGDALVAQLHAGMRSRAAALEALVAGFSVQGVQQVDVRAALDELRIPVSVFWGRLDQVIPWSHALEASPRVALHLFPEAGHMPQWESSALLGELILRQSAASSPP